MTSEDPARKYIPKPKEGKKTVSSDQFINLKVHPITSDDPARKYIPKPKDENKTVSSDQSSENKNGVLRIFNKEMPVNQAQRIVLGCVLGYIIATILFPPWVRNETSRIPTSLWTSVEVPGRTSRGGGADFVFDLPYNATVDAPMLLVHIIAAVVIGAIAFIGLGLKNKNG